MNTDYRFEFILNNNDGSFIYYENLLTSELERTNYDRRIMDWLLNTNIEHGRETRFCPHCLYERNNKNKDCYWFGWRLGINEQEKQKWMTWKLVWKNL